MTATFAPDLVITDLMMPRVSGSELIAALRARRELDNVPILVLTARADEALSAELLRAGAQDYVRKPFSNDELLARVGNLLAQRRAAELLRRELTSRSRDLVQLAREVVERKREAETAWTRAEQESRAKDEFFALLSHELRTPLTPSFLWLPLLKDESVEPAVREHGLAVIEKCLRTQLKVVEDLLNVSSCVAGKMQIERAFVNLPQVVEMAVDAMAGAAAAKGIRITTEIDGSLPGVLGDGERLQQVVWNLVANAVKFTPPGGRVEVRLGQRGGSAAIVVADSGIGIEADFLPHVFERFRQADSSASRRYEGLGLGLSIVRHLVELHGGRVFAESAGPGAGSTFAVELPLPAENLAVPPPLPAHMRGNGSRLGGLRVLLVEDDPSTQDALQAILVRGGAEVSVVANAHDAVRLIENWQPDVIVSDIGLPDQDGYDLIRRVRALAPGRGGSIPAVAVTAYARDDERRRALAAGFQAHLAKPVDPHSLLEALGKVMTHNERATGTGAVGIQARNVEPTSGVLSTSMRPPSTSSRRRTT